MHEVTLQPGDKHGIPLFFLLCFFLSWPVWVVQALHQLGVTAATIPPESPLNMPAVWAPGLAAIVVTACGREKGRLRALFKPLGRWRLGVWWCAAILCLPAALRLLSIAIDRALGRGYAVGTVFAALGPGGAAMVPLLIILALPNALGEELGWRGFALPKLAHNRGALAASLIMGLVWSAWHLPLLLSQGLTNAALVLSALSAIPAAILHSWIYLGTGGSLFAAWLFHASFTIAGYLLDLPRTHTDEILIWPAAAVVVLAWRPGGFSWLRKMRTTAGFWDGDNGGVES